MGEIYKYANFRKIWWSVNTPGASQVTQWQRICLSMQRHKRHGFDPWVGKIPWSRKWQPTPVFLPGKFHGQMSLVGYIVHGVTKSQMGRKLNITSTQGNGNFRSLVLLLVRVRDILVLVSIITGYFRDSASRNLPRKKHVHMHIGEMYFNHSPTKIYLGFS